MVGAEENPVQIDEAYFAGWRKYNRGRLLVGDKHHPLENEVDEEEEEEEEEDKGQYEPEDDDEIPDDVPVVKTRAKKSVWVFGLAQKPNWVRMFIVPDRKAATLLPIIQAHVAPGSHISSDEWRG